MGPLRRRGPILDRHTGAVDRAELRAWVEDALRRHERDVRERDEDVASVTVTEIVDAVWGRLPLEIRRASTRSDVQASLTMLTARHGIATTRTDESTPAIED